MDTATSYAAFVRFMTSAETPSDVSASLSDAQIRRNDTAQVLEPRPVTSLGDGSDTPLLPCRGVMDSSKERGIGGDNAAEASPLSPASPGDASPPAHTDAPVDLSGGISPETAEANFRAMHGVSFETWWIAHADRIGAVVPWISESGGGLMKHPFVIAIDSREQRPFDFPAWPVVSATLVSGDYSISGLESLCAVERKSLPDLVACVGPERERFRRELHRLRGYRCRAVVIEATVADVVEHRYRSKVHPSAVLGSVASWQTRYSVPFSFAGAHGPEMALAVLRTFFAQVQELVDAVSGTVVGT